MIKGYMTDKIEGTLLVKIDGIRLHGYEGSVLIHVRVMLPKVLDKILLK